MNCNCQENYIKIFKGDDTNWNYEQWLTVNLTSDTVDLSSMTAKFILGSYSKEFPLNESTSFNVDLSAAVTGSFNFGPASGIIKIYDSEGRVKTVSNSIPFYVTETVFTPEQQSIDIGVPAGSPVEINITVAGGGGGGGVAVWGQIAGTLSNQTDLQDALDAKQDVINDLSTIRSGAELGATAIQQSDLTTALATKQDVISDLATIRSGAALGATSIQQSDLTTALATKQDKLSQTQLDAVNSGIDATKVAQIATNTGDISTINGKIPSQASTENQLADKNFVNSTVSTQTAYFDGSWETYSDIPSTEAGFETAGYPAPTNNNYLVVVADETQDGGTWRYKYVDEGTGYAKANWKAEYEVNETPLTAAQLAAINSGITSALVTQIGTNTTDIAGKQDIINDLSTIRSGAALGATAVQPSGLSTLQPKTLETPITVGGVSQTTVEGALGAINTNTDGALKNTATGSNALGILAGSVTNEKAVAIGKTSGTVNALATVIGTNATVNGGTGAIAIGGSDSINNRTSARFTRAIAIGSSAYGSTACEASAQDAIQLGIGTNSTANTFQVYSYPMLDGTTGLIPSDRIPTASSTVKGGVKIAFDSGTGVLNIITE